MAAILQRAQRADISVSMNWDDLRIISAVRSEGTYAGAGARLRIDETTVSRRLARIERTLGVTLFEAMDGVRRPTSDCDVIAAHIEAMSRHVAEIGAVNKRVAGPVGRLRIASTNTIAEAVLAPQLPQLLRDNPGLTVHLTTSNENVNFSRWEADLAVRLRKPERGDFKILKLADFALYLFEPAGPTAGDPVVCCYPASLDFTPESKFLASRGLQAGARFVTDNIRAIRTLIENRNAVGVLPSYMCENLLADRRLKKTLLPRRREVWLLIQSHLQQSRPTRVVIEWLQATFQTAAQ
jgi:DNA-binding transcriptional LysR family regulator